MQTVIKLLLLITLFGCGKEVKIDSSRLESMSNITGPESLRVSQEGTLNRMSGPGTHDTIVSQGKTFRVSKYSSYQALEFIAAKPLSSQTAVKFKGQLKSSEIVLELVE